MTNLHTCLHPLPKPDEPNNWIRADLFGPMQAASRQHEYIFCITGAFTKYALVTPIENKEAETVAKTISVRKVQLGHHIVDNQMQLQTAFIINASTLIKILILVKKALQILTSCHLLT